MVKIYSHCQIEMAAEFIPVGATQSHIARLTEYPSRKTRQATSPIFLSRITESTQKATFAQAHSGVHLLFELSSSVTRE